MKITFSAQYTMTTLFPVEVTIWCSMKDTQATIMIEDKDIRKTVIRPIDLRRITVHKDFSVFSHNGVLTAERERDQRTSNPTVNLGVYKGQTTKELLCDIYERELIVDAGTFDKLVKTFHIFPDTVELLFD